MHYTLEQKIKGMRESGRILRRIFREVSKNIVPNITTNDLDEIAKYYMDKYGAVAAPLTVGFPGNICTSVNDIMIHGVPNNSTALRSNDIISLDISISVDGWFTDACRTYVVQPRKNNIEIPEELLYLSNVAFMATEMAIDVVRPQIPLYALSAISDSVISNAGCSLIKNFTGHFIGRKLHEQPWIDGYINPKDANYYQLKVGDTFTIEPLVKLGTNTDYRILEDGWSIQSLDGQPSAQHENTVLVTEDGFEILT